MRMERAEKNEALAVPRPQSCGGAVHVARRRWNDCSRGRTVSSAIGGGSGRRDSPGVKPLLTSISCLLSKNAKQIWLSRRAVCRRGGDAAALALLLRCLGNRSKDGSGRGCFGIGPDPKHALLAGVALVREDAAVVVQRWWRRRVTREIVARRAKNSEGGDDLPSNVDDCVRTSPRSVVNALEAAPQTEEAPHTQQSEERLDSGTPLSSKPAHGHPRCSSQFKPSMRSRHGEERGVADGTSDKNSVSLSPGQGSTVSGGSQYQESSGGSLEMTPRLPRPTADDLNSPLAHLMSPPPACSEHTDLLDGAGRGNVSENLPRSPGGFADSVQQPCCHGHNLSSGKVIESAGADVTCCGAHRDEAGSVDIVGNHADDRAAASGTHSTVSRSGGDAPNRDSDAAEGLPEIPLAAQVAGAMSSKCDRRESSGSSSRARRNEEELGRGLPVWRGGLPARPLAIHRGLPPTPRSFSSGAGLPATSVPTIHHGGARRPCTPRGKSANAAVRPVTPRGASASSVPVVVRRPMTPRGILPIATCKVSQPPPVPTAGNQLCGQAPLNKESSIVLPEIVKTPVASPVKNQTTPLPPLSASRHVNMHADEYSRISAHAGKAASVSAVGAPVCHSAAITAADASASSSDDEKASGSAIAMPRLQPTPPPDARVGTAPRRPMGRRLMREEASTAAASREVSESHHDV